MFCQSCHAELHHRRADARYCSGKCRQQAYLDRRVARAAGPVPTTGRQWFIGCAEYIGTDFVAKRTAFRALLKADPDLLAAIRLIRAFVSDTPESHT